MGEKEEKERAIEEAKKNKPSAASIFGSAKPVDTYVREKEIEEKLSKMTTSDSDKVDSSRAYKSNPTRRGEDIGFDRRRDDRRQPDNRGYDRDRRDDRGYDRDRRDGDRGYDRKDNRDYRRDDRHDDRGSQRNGRDDRDQDRRDDRRSAEKEESDRNGKKEGSVEKAPVEKSMKKIEEPAPVAVVANKYAFLQEEDGVGSGEEQED